MQQIVVEAQRRNPGGKNANRRLRKSGRMPAVVYGAGREPLPLSVDPEAISGILHSQSGHNTIFAVSVEGQAQANVMVKDYQLDPVRGNLIHADMYAIAMDQLLELTVDVEMVGESEGVKTDGGIMDVVTRSLQVECLPSDIPKSIQVDVSHLKINDYIRVKNLPSNPKVKILSDPEVVIVTIVPPVKEEVVEVAPVAPAEPELIRKGKAVEEGGEEEEKGKTARQSEKSKPESK
ncbi:MAG: ribosomal protein [Acidobacteria bacterium]|jgi:large subunit ribosomal protein L25|nr:ribosomal protein [Acidobacteriota bacterium]